GDPGASPSMRFDDDGEPSGTAGRPILNVLQRRKVGDALLVVVRYFGGVKLGAGGLVRAYSGTASRLLDQVELASPSARSTFAVRLDYADEQSARHILRRLGIEIVSADYSRDAVLTVRTSDEERARARAEISEVTSGRARFEPDEDAI
ncbi:MAG TPA: YigZ family protein, partial [Vicinamibacteria bacterium]|nr:YigZ family protein [Vicinamibacteria bacterium]